MAWSMAARSDSERGGSLALATDCSRDDGELRAASARLDWADCSKSRPAAAKLVKGGAAIVAQSLKSGGRVLQSLLNVGSELGLRV